MSDSEKVVEYVAIYLETNRVLEINCKTFEARAVVPDAGSDEMAGNIAAWLNDKDETSKAIFEEDVAEFVSRLRSSKHPYRGVNDPFLMCLCGRHLDNDIHYSGMAWNHTFLSRGDGVCACGNTASHPIHEI